MIIDCGLRCHLAVIPVLFASKAHNICWDMSRCLKIINNESLQLRKRDNMFMLSKLSGGCREEEERPHGLAVGRHEALLLPLLLLHLVLALRLAHSCPSGSLHLQVRDNLRLVTCLTFAAARGDQTGCHPDCRPSPPWIRYEIVFSSGIHPFHPIDI